MDKRTPSLRGEVLGADTTGPSVASQYILVELGRFRLKPRGHLFSFRRPESTLFGLVGYTRRTPCETLQRLRSATAERGRSPFFHVGVTTDVEAEPLAG